MYIEIASLRIRLQFALEPISLSLYFYLFVFIFCVYGDYAMSVGLKKNGAN